MGIDLRELTVRPDTDFVMMAAGGLMGIRTGVSLLVGAVINYMILAPWMISAGDIHPKIVNGVAQYGFRQITMWSLWGGVAMMTTASLLCLLLETADPDQRLPRHLCGSEAAAAKSDILRDIELPMKVFVIGIPLVGAAVVFMAHHFFGVRIWLGVVAIPLVFVFTLIGVNSTALTSITPTGALGKLTQLTYGALAPGNISTNLMTAGITARGGRQRLQPAHGHQARLHARRQAASAGHRSRAGDHCRSAGRGAGVLHGLPPSRSLAIGQ